jgi:hypothetical protein
MLSRLAYMKPTPSVDAMNNSSVQKRIFIPRAESRSDKKQKRTLERVNRLVPVHEICCCKRDCLSYCYGSNEARERDRSTYFSFSNQVDRKAWLKTKLLAGVEDTDDLEMKEFQIQGFAVCYKAVH